MVDDERVTRLASGVRQDLNRLSALSQTEGLLDRPDQLDAVKYRFVTAIEGCLSIAHHILAAEGWGAPDSNADAMRVLAERGVISRECAATMARAAGFRNLLVHRYGRIEDSAVVANLGELDDVRQFVTQVLGWLEGLSRCSSTP